MFSGVSWIFGINYPGKIGISVKSSPPLQSRLKLIQYTAIVGKDNYMSERSRVAEFVSFCIEAYAKAKGMSGSDVFRLFDSCGLVRYLDEGYDILHTQGREWLLEDMADYLKVRGIAA